MRRLSLLLRSITNNPNDVTTSLSLHLYPLAYLEGMPAEGHTPRGIITLLFLRVDDAIAGDVRWITKNGDSLITMRLENGPREYYRILFITGWRRFQPLNSFPYLAKFSDSSYRSISSGDTFNHPAPLFRTPSPNPLPTPAAHSPSLIKLAQHGALKTGAHHHPSGDRFRLFLDRMYF